jgi:hypothetical protein
MENAAGNVAQGTTAMRGPSSFVAASSLNEPRSPWIATRSRFMEYQSLRPALIVQQVNSPHGAGCR